MQEPEARAALASIGVHPEVVSPVSGGWANFTFELDGELMVRFPSSEAVAQSTQRELRLLPVLEPALDVAIPHPVHSGAWNGWPFFTYRKIMGRPLRADDNSQQIRSALRVMLTQLHSFPTNRAAELLSADPHAGWRTHYERLWPTVESVALPDLEAATAASVVDGYERFLSSSLDFSSCLVHADLFSDHVLVDDGTVQISGIIDFENACIGDPVIDFVPLVEVLGFDLLPDLTSRRELGSQAPLRFWFYRWMSGIHNLIYGITEHADAERASGNAEVTNRILEPLPPESLFAPSVP